MSTPTQKTPIIVENYLELFEMQNTILEMMAGDATQQEVLDRLCLLQEKLVPNAVATIMRYDERNRKLSLLAAPSLDKARWHEFEGLVPGPKNGSCANVIYHEEPQFVSCIAGDERWEENLGLAERFHLKACWSMPVYADEKVAGTFALSSFIERKPSPFEKMLLSIGARIVSIVLNREKHREQMRRQQKRVYLLARVFENVSEGIVITDKKNRIVEVNPAFEAITGYKEEEVRGTLPVSMVDSEDKVALRRDIVRKIREKGFWRGEMKIVRADGRRSFEWVSISKLKRENGETDGFLYVVSDINELKVSQQKMAYMAFHDTLTGLANRDMLMERISHVIDRAERVPLNAAVLFLDLDRFKYLNDTFGHTAGDQLLIEVGKRLSHALRKGDTIARFGGDEFVVLLEDVDDRGYILDKARSLLALLKKPFEFEKHSFVIYGSIGIAMFPDDGTDGQTLLKHADTAMYQAKRSQEHIRFYAPQMSEHTLKSLVLEKELHEALKRREFEVYYQPIVNGADRSICCAEALVRWHHPERGLVFPSEFIPFSEETGLISQVDEYVLGTVIADLRRWHTDPSNKIVPISVNISGRHINQRDVTRLIHILNKSALGRDYIGLELTETYLMQFAEETVVQLERLKHAGVKLSMDDFGSGYSSLGYLKRFKIDKLKIDQLLVRDIVKDNDDRSIADAIIKMGHSLGLEIIAEGVETEAQFETLQTFGCDMMQGFLFDRALPSDVFVEKYIRRSR